MVGWSAILVLATLTICWAQQRATRLTVERALRTSEAKARAVFDQTSQFIGLLDPQGTVLETNRSALEFAAVSAESVLGKPFWKTPWWSHSVEAQAKLKAAIVRSASGEFVRFETTHRAADGSIHTVDFSLKPMCDEQGTVVWLIPEGRDISELRCREEAFRLAKEEAEAASRAKSEFLANMSHEIRTPMSAIIGYAELLANDASVSDDPTQRVEAAQTIQQNCDHLLTIINDLLDLSKIEAGKFSVNPVDCSPANIVREVLALMQVRSKSKGIKLEVSYDTPLPERIWIDPLRLRQILVNLLGNAIKFTDFGSVRLIVRLVPGDAPMLEFDVVDTGIGMTEAEQQRLFHPFSQADASVTRRFGGTGLGLTISKRLAEMLGGDVFVVNSTPHLGTRFRLTVATGPLDNVPNRMPGPDADLDLSKTVVESEKTSAGALCGARLLLAEDGPDNQRLIRFLLTKAGAEVTVVENGQQAIDAALEQVERGQPFDVILMDMQMPLLDGYGATALLRAIGYSGTVVALTAHAMNGDQEKCLAAGCDDFAPKPVDRTKLIPQIATHIKRLQRSLPLPAFDQEVAAAQEV